MRYSKYIIEDRTVEFYNSLLGVESVLVNNKEVSKGFSLFGRDHVLNIGVNEYKLRPYLSFSHPSSVGMSIYKNNVIQKLEKEITASDHIHLFLKVSLIITAGICIGLGLAAIMAP